MKEIRASALALLRALWDSVRGVAVAVLQFFLSCLFQLWPAQAIGHWLRDNMPGVWHWLMRQPVVQRALSKAVVRKFGRAAPPRPHALTMLADYATWEGFQDRTITARHLPPHDDPDLPPIDDLLPLFHKGAPVPKGADRPGRSTFLFAAFAQWFTDSFLRTAHGLGFDPQTGAVLKDDGDMPVREAGRVARTDSNHEIDLCQIYGLTPAATRALRVDTNAADFNPKDRGCLRYQRTIDGDWPAFLLEKQQAFDPETGELRVETAFREMYPEPLLRHITGKARNVDRGMETLFAVGLEHGNSTVGNSLFNTLFLREHNRIARETGLQHPDWDDEKIFQLTRNTMIVLLLKVVVSHYIRHISPLDLPLKVLPRMASGEEWYRPNRIHVEFNILYRWHGLVPDAFPFLDPDPVQSWGKLGHNNGWLMDRGLNAAITDLVGVQAGRIGLGQTPDNPIMKGIKRGTLSLMRSARLAPYNAYRQRYGLEPAKDFRAVTGERELSARLSELYDGDINRLEWYIGMMAEAHGRRMLMGELQFTMVAHDAFTHALTNPLLAPEVFVPDTFGDVGWEVIGQTETLQDIIDRLSRDGAPEARFDWVA